MHRRGAWMEGERGQKGGREERTEGLVQRRGEAGEQGVEVKWSRRRLR